VISRLVVRNHILFWTVRWRRTASWTRNIL